MTATIKPPRGRRIRRRPLRFSSMESLGFSDAASTWSETPRIKTDGRPRGRHITRPPEPADLADWQPQEFGKSLDSGNVRWSRVTGLIVLLVGLAALGLWLQQRPAAQQRAATAEVVAKGRVLQAMLHTLADFNAGLLVAGPATGTADLDEVEEAARSLFDASGDLASGQSELRNASSQTAGFALDATRLAAEAHAYRSAVLPVLVTPDLETDPALIELDEAARAFGDWQLSFDDVRVVLPDDVFPEVTEQLDILSGDLASILSRYVDALRQHTKTEGVVGELGSRLATIDAILVASVEETQTRVDERIAVIRRALDRLLNG